MSILAGILVELQRHAAGRRASVRRFMPICGTRKRNRTARRKDRKTAPSMRRSHRWREDIRLGLGLGHGLRSIRRHRWRDGHLCGRSRLHRRTFTDRDLSSRLHSHSRRQFLVLHLHLASNLCRGIRACCMQAIRSRQSARFPLGRNSALFRRLCW